MSQSLFARLDQCFKAGSRTQILILTFELLLAVGIPDFLIGADISLSIFYLLPVFIATMYANRAMGAFVACAAIVPEIASMIFYGQIQSQPGLVFWNTFLRLTTLALIVVLIDSLKRHMENEASLARKDPVTGLFNRYGFMERLEYQIALMARDRIPMALAYIDLDNFKQINDRFGHAEGDKVLRVIAHALQLSTRQTDTAARLGGDEFAVLLHGADRTQVEVLIQKIKNNLAKDRETAQRGVTCSIGCITFNGHTPDMDSAVKAADSLMYEVKRRGKDGILVQDFGGRLA